MTDAVANLGIIGEAWSINGLSVPKVFNSTKKERELAAAHYKANLKFVQQSTGILRGKALEELEEKKRLLGIALGLAAQSKALQKLGGAKGKAGATPGAKPSAKAGAKPSAKASAKAGAKSGSTRDESGSDSDEEEEEEEEPAEDSAASRSNRVLTIPGEAKSKGSKAKAAAATAAAAVAVENGMAVAEYALSGTTTVQRLRTEVALAGISQADKMDATRRSLTEKYVRSVGDKLRPQPPLLLFIAGKYADPFTITSKTKPKDTISLHGPVLQALEDWKKDVLDRNRDEGQLLMGTMCSLAFESVKGDKFMPADAERLNQATTSLTRQEVVRVAAIAEAFYTDGPNGGPQAMSKKRLEDVEERINGCFDSVRAQLRADEQRAFRRKVSSTASHSVELRRRTRSSRDDSADDSSGSSSDDDSDAATKKRRAGKHMARKKRNAPKPVPRAHTPAPSTPAPDRRKCFNCNQLGHLAINCPLPRKTSKPRDKKSKPKAAPKAAATNDDDSD